MVLIVKPETMTSICTVIVKLFAKIMLKHYHSVSVVVDYNRSDYAM